MLKNQEHVDIRSIRLDDAVARHEFFCELSRAQIGMIHSLDEIDEDSQESFDAIHDFLRNHRGAWLVAESKGKILGEVDISIKPFKRVRHVGLLTIGVSPRFQGLGLGALLMQEALRWAGMQGLLRIELFTFASNIVAQNLYTKLGFVQEGTRKNYLRHENGLFEDDYLFAKYL